MSYQLIRVSPKSGKLYTRLAKHIGTWEEDGLHKSIYRFNNYIFYECARDKEGPIYSAKTNIKIVGIKQ